MSNESRLVMIDEAGDKWWLPQMTRSEREEFLRRLQRAAKRKT